MNVIGDALAPVIDRTSIAEQAYQAIKKMILELQLSPGEVITEAQLSALLNISKSPIRSALIHLQRDGLVIATPYKDTIVSDLSVQHVCELYEVRTLFEPHVVAAVAPRLKEVELQRIDAILRTAEDALEERDYVSFFNANTMFHGYFVQQYGNIQFSRILREIDSQMQRIRMISSKILGHPAKQVKEHRGIYEQLCAGNGDVAGDLMKMHILGYYNDLMAEIESGRLDWFTRGRS